MPIRRRTGGSWKVFFASYRCVHSCSSHQNTAFIKNFDSAMGTQNPSESIVEINFTIGKILAHAPFSKQVNGLPYWNKDARYDFGVPTVLEWLAPNMEAEFIAACRALNKWTLASLDAESVLKCIKKLPHMKNSASHVMTAWMVVCAYLESQSARNGAFHFIVQTLA